MQLAVRAPRRPPSRRHTRNRRGAGRGCAPPRACSSVRSPARMAEGGDRRAAPRAARSRGARATPAASMAMSASSLGAGMSVTRCRRRARCGRAPATIDTPMTRWPGLASMHAAHVVVAHGEVARDAGDHAVGVAHRHHAGARRRCGRWLTRRWQSRQQVALALQALVEVRRRRRVLRVRQPGVVDLDAARRQLDAERCRWSPRTCSSRPIRIGRAEPVVREAHRRRGSSAPPRPRRRRCACGVARTRSNDALQRSRRSDRAAPRAAPRRRPCRRSAGAPRRYPSPPWRRPAASREISRGSNGTGMM